MTIKHCILIGIVREQVPNYLTFKRKPQRRCSLRSRESGSSSRCTMPLVFFVCLYLHEQWTHNGVFDSKNVHLQPSSRPQSLLNFIRIILPVKRIFLPLEDREEQTSFLRQDLGECLLSVGLQDVFSPPPVEFLIEKACLVGGGQLFWIHGSWVYEISWSPSHGKFQRFATQSYLCVCHRRCFTYQLGGCDLRQSGLVQIFRGCIAQSNSHVGSIWPRSAVQLEVSPHGAFHRIRAYYEDDGKPYLHKSPLDSSGKCPSIHEVWR